MHAEPSLDPSFSPKKWWALPSHNYAGKCTKALLLTIVPYPAAFFKSWVLLILKCACQSRSNLLSHDNHICQTFTLFFIAFLSYWLAILFRSLHRLFSTVLISTFQEFDIFLLFLQIRLDINNGLKVDLNSLRWVKYVQFNPTNFKNSKISPGGIHFYLFSKLFMGFNQQWALVNTYAHNLRGPKFSKFQRSRGLIKFMKISSAKFSAKSTVSW